MTRPPPGGTWRITISASGLKQVLMDARPALVRYLSARGASIDETEDVLQALFLKLDEGEIGPVAEPRAYLYRMAGNLWLDRRRAAARRARREEEWAGIQAGAVAETDDRPSPEDHLIARERLRAVTDALSTLPPRTVEVFRRFRVDGEPQRSIGADLGISVSAVEKHLQRAYHVVIEVKTRLDAEDSGPRRPGLERESHGA